MKQELRIKDFKVFEDQSISLTNLTVLAGSNSVGKSTVIQALLLIRQTFQERFKFGRDVERIPIALNGPFLLELGNTYEVIRRGKKVSESIIEFSLFEQENPILNLALEGDRTKSNVYELKTIFDRFENNNRGILGQKIYYLCAERIGPRLKYEYEIMLYLHAGYRGEHTFQVLSIEDLFIDPLKAFRTDGPNQLYYQARLWLDYIIPGARFDNAVPLGKSKVIEGTFGDSLPTNVGFGISYVLPIIVNGLLAEPDTILIVENPEAHLHPSGQSRVGRFLSLIASTGVQVIIETHSEHVINGIRLAMLEGDKIKSNEAIVNFMHKDQDDKTIIREIRFDDEAEFDQFPPGFIDQDQRDTAEMFRIIKRKNA